MVHRPRPVAAALSTRTARPRQAKRFGPVSVFVRFPPPPPRWRRPVAVLLGTMVGVGVGLTGPMAASLFVAVALIALIASRWNRYRRARAAWNRWALEFESDLPALHDELRALPTAHRLHTAGVAIAYRLSRERIPTVPADEVDGPCEVGDRLPRWVSARCECVPDPFHRGLEAGWRRAQAAR